MEAATLQKKKTSISKGKMKKTIKNVLCRPDPVFWPNLTEEQSKSLETALCKFKVDIPEFRKPHWKEIQSIPKEQRLKPPKIKRVEGLIFGITECTKSLESKECSAVLIESTVNPRAIMQPLIEACVTVKVPVLCFEGLKKLTSKYFGIPTSCLAVKTNFYQELISNIKDIEKLHKPPEPISNKDNLTDKMEVDANTEKEISKEPLTCPYLYRTSKKIRVFNPSIQETNVKKAFIGQDFIEFADKSEQTTSDSKAYMSMILKRITNNQNRLKRYKEE